MKIQLNAQYTQQMLNQKWDQLAQQAQIIKQFESKQIDRYYNVNQLPHLLFDLKLILEEIDNQITDPSLTHTEFIKQTHQHVQSYIKTFETIHNIIELASYDDLEKASHITQHVNTLVKFNKQLSRIAQLLYPNESLKQNPQINNFNNKYLLQFVVPTLKDITTFTNSISNND